MSDPPNLVETLNETEGLCQGLYYHLWKKTHKGECCPGINIPHTVIYQDCTPVAWYFTSAKDGKIYRKKKSNVSGPAICEAMMHKHPEIDASAWFSGTMTFMSATAKKKRSGRSGQPGEPVYELEPEEDTKEPACFDYLAKDRLQRLVAPGQYTAITESIYDGVLQKFILPREANDHVIRAIWSPTAVVCERRYSTYALSDARQTLTDRMASFDTNTFWLSTHQPLPVGSVLVQRLTTACESIVDHLAEISAGRISVARMQLFFKVDVHNKIWLTLCNSMKLDRAAANVDRAPAPVKTTLRGRSAEEDDTRLPDDPQPFMCVLTGDTHPGSERCDVSYKLLIGHWFKQVEELAEESDRLQALDALPPAIRRANPNITRDFYLKMRSQPAFLLRTAPVCRQAAASLTVGVLKDLSRSITRPKSALAESAVKAPLPLTSTRQAEELAAAASAAAKKPSQASNSGGLKLMIKKGPVVLPPSDPNVLYEPGAQVPAALVPKAALTGTLGSTGLHTSLMRSRGGPTMVAVVASPSGAYRNTAPPPGATMVTMSLQSPSAAPGAPQTRKLKVLQPRAQAAAVGSPQAAPSQSPGKADFDARPGPSHKAASSAAQPGTKAAGDPYIQGAEGAGKGKGAATVPVRTSHVSSEDLKKLKQLSDDVASAEQVTKKLLAEAQNILGDASAAPQGKAGSRPPSGKVTRTSSNKASGAAATAGMLQPKENGLVVSDKTGGPPTAAPAGLTTDEAALLSDALQAPA